MNGAFVPGRGINNPIADLQGVGEVIEHGIERAYLRVAQLGKTRAIFCPHGVAVKLAQIHRDAEGHTDDALIEGMVIIDFIRMRIVTPDGLHQAATPAPPGDFGHVFNDG